jgi:hypothetical protein
MFESIICIVLLIGKKQFWLESMSTKCQLANEKIKGKGGGRTWVCSHET